VEVHTGQPEEVILEIIKIPGNGLPVEAVSRIAVFVIEVPRGLNLEPWQHLHHFAVSCNHLRSNLRTVALAREELKQRGVSEVLFQIRAMRSIFRVNLGNREPVSVKVAGKRQKRSVLFGHIVANADGSVFGVGQAHNGSAGASQATLHRLHAQRPGTESLLEEPLQNVHAFPPCRLKSIRALRGESKAAPKAPAASSRSKSMNYCGWAIMMDGRRDRRTMSNPENNAAPRRSLLQSAIHNLFALFFGITPPAPGQEGFYAAILLGIILLIVAAGWAVVHILLSHLLG
jgi:hypothetical protein